ncbi:TonB family protein [Kangiella koreensis DSM 16069]|uniref:TonB family protein n=1 Tax=Kangiella koreensis (strain DSM 16069 / JCM 12317 / KCTC 12182 / SW-125) TaxID=523791 RepID=C7R9Y1_KANKD|nr:TonB family protein [Kangiella koreensis DSM 16069]
MAKGFGVKKFDKWILFPIAVPVGILFCFSLTHNFIPVFWWEKVSFYIAIVLGFLISITVFRYQFKVWLPRNKIKKYSFKWCLNIFLVFFAAPLMGTLASFHALSVGIGKVENALFGEPETYKIYNSTVNEVSNSRAWCHLYLEPIEFNDRYSSYKFCIEDMELSSLVNSVNVKIKERVSSLGRKAIDWELINFKTREDEINGYVLFRFDIETDGTPTNIKVIYEHPKGIFTKEALRAIKKWKFKVKVVDGKPVKQYGMKYKLDFVLDE